MIAYGDFRNGHVELDPAYSLPEGARLKLIVMPQPQPDEGRGGMREMFARYDELVKDVPEEEWAKLPIDGGINHDHYLYGAPKRSVD